MTSIFLKHVSFSFTFQTPAIRAMSSSKPQRYSVWIGKRNAPMESVEAINTMLREQGFHYECHTRNWEQGGYIVSCLILFFTGQHPGPTVEAVGSIVLAPSPPDEILRPKTSAPFPPEAPQEKRRPITPERSERTGTFDFQLFHFEFS